MHHPFEWLDWDVHRGYDSDFDPYPGVGEQIRRSGPCLGFAWSLLLTLKKWWVTTHNGVMESLGGWARMLTPDETTNAFIHMEVKASPKVA